MKTRIRKSPFALAAILGLSILALGCANTNFEIGTEHTDAQGFHDPAGEAAVSPQSFADRFGEPDVWRHDGEDDDRVSMTQIWYCVEGEYREVSWRLRQQEHGTSWQIVNDISRACDVADDEREPLDGR